MSSGKLQHPFSFPYRLVISLFGVGITVNNTDIDRKFQRDPPENQLCCRLGGFVDNLGDFRHQRKGTVDHHLIVQEEHQLRRASLGHIAGVC